MARIKRLFKRIKRWEKIYQFFRILGKIWKVFIAILGPAMSIFILVDDFMNKDNPNKKKPVEAIGIRYE